MGDDWLKVMNAQTEVVLEKNDNPPLKAKVKRINNNSTIDVSVNLPEQEMPWEIPDIPLTNNLKISKGDYVTVKFLENNPTSPVIDGMFNPQSSGGDGEDGRSILSVDKVESDGLVDIYRITYSKEPVYSYFQVKNGDNANITSISISDLNNAIETGFYNCYSADNAPSTGFYTIEVNTDGSNVIQTATNVNGDMYTRIGYDVQNNPSWDAWKKSNVDSADLSDVKNELLSKIGDNITIETYTNGIRYKKDGTYIYSACWGNVNLTTTGTNGTASTTVNYPFTFSGNLVSMGNPTTNTPMIIAGSTQSTGSSSLVVTLQRSSAGTSSVRWIVIGV